MKLHRRNDENLSLNEIKNLKNKENKTKKLFQKGNETENIFLALEKKNQNQKQQKKKRHDIRTILMKNQFH